jgi:lipid A 4'-phosphatase
MQYFKNYQNARLFRYDWLLFFIFVFIFFLLPEIDISVTNLFFNFDQGFEFARLNWVMLSYWVFAKIHFFYFFVLFYLLLHQLILRRFKTLFTRKIIFIIFALVLGPGLVVNHLFKENWGRARPHEVTQYGGVNHYTAPFVKSNECDGNCSFVSGHASGAFFLLTLTWVLGSRKWFWLGLLVGGVVGLGRMLQGGHFLSDIVFSFWFVYFSSQVSAALFGFKAPNSLGFIHHGPSVK